jgi:hypothetical protein
MRHLRRRSPTTCGAVYPMIVWRAKNICLWAATSSKLTPIESASYQQRFGKVFGQPATADTNWLPMANFRDRPSWITSGCRLFGSRCDICKHERVWRQQSAKRAGIPGSRPTIIKRARKRVCLSMLWSDATYYVLETGVGSETFETRIVLEIHQPC